VPVFRSMRCILLKKVKFPFSYFLIGIIIFLSIYISYEIYPFKSTADRVTFITAVVGVIISFTAFIIAMKTYISIDSVNVITQMEGNVLENENYVASVTSLLKEYDMPNSRDAGKAVFDNLENKFARGSKTANEFANNLQYFIDLIVFFPYLYNTADEHKDYNLMRMDKILTLIDKRRDALLSISIGNLTLIEETVKLIRCVINYQQLVHTNEYQMTSTLLEVRGNMLKNPVTQMVYYNYLGLFYNKKANMVLRKKFGIETVDFFSLDGARKVKNSIDLLTNEEAELFIMYLNEAKKAFKRAMDNKNDDLMWEGFIKFNEARTTYLLQLTLDDYQGTQWIDLMNEAVVARNRLNILMDDILYKEERTHLQEAFIYESYLASLIKINLMIAEEIDITDQFNRSRYLAPHYDGLQEDPLLKEAYGGKFDKIQQYQDRIRQEA
jgi:hypothetical protein